MPALIAVCPKCSNDAQVPEDAVGKKVKCKKCQHIFVIEPLPTGKIEKITKRPKTKSPGRPDTQSAGSKSGSIRRPEKKSNAILYIVLGVVAVAAIGAGAAGFYLNNNRQPAEPTQARTPPPKERKDAKPRSEPTRIESKKGDGSSKTAIARVDPKTPREPREPKAPPEFKSVEAPVAPLLKTTAVEVADLGTIRDVFLMQGATLRVGIRIKEKTKSHFEIYDLDKDLRIGRFEIPKDTLYADVDPEGTVLALCDNDKFLTVYELPSGAQLQEDWRPYHDNRQDSRKIGESGDYAQFSMLSKDHFLVLTTRNAGDIWDVRTKTLKSSIIGFSHEQFRNSNVTRGHDCGLSADRTMFAYATDEGIVFLDTRTGEKVGQPANLSKFGPKVDVLGIGFDPEKKSIAAYIAAGKDVQLARFQVPGGELVGEPELLDASPGDFANIAFVTGNVFLREHPGGKNKDANRAASLVDLSGRQLVECVFSPPRYGMFSVNVARKQVAFAYLNKDKPAVGVVEIPTPSSASAAPAASEMPTASGDKEKSAEKEPPPSPSKGLNLLDVINKNPTPQAKTPNAKDKSATAMPPPAPTLRQERWEFGAHGIAKKGETR